MQPEKPAPKKRDKLGQAWSDLAVELHGTIEENRRGSLQRIRLPHRGWTLLLERYVVSTGHGSHTYTRMRVPIRPRVPFRMRVFRDNALYRVGKLFGMQDIVAGDPNLDREFVLQSDTESVVISLFLDRRLQAALREQRGFRLEVVPLSRKQRQGMDATSELRLITNGAVRDPARLRSMVSLMRTALDAIDRVAGA
jgi:hypothetical protein